jgi:CRISPR-associated protein Cas2
MKPGTERHWHLISYDVSDDKRRAKVAKCLEGFGERVQFSVFRVYVSPRGLARLRWELSRRMDPTDGLLLIHLCPSCQSSVQDQRGKRDWREEAPKGFRVAGEPIKHLLTEEPQSTSDATITSSKPRPRKPRSMKA